ncbi:hypothetical protein EV401DRAFT_1927398, partial [Pisolithus croceorrhizus]
MHRSNMDTVRNLLNPPYISVILDQYLYLRPCRLRCRTQVQSIVPARGTPSALCTLTPMSIRTSTGMYYIHLAARFIIQVQYMYIALCITQACHLRQFMAHLGLRMEWSRLLVSPRLHRACHPSRSYIPRRRTRARHSGAGSKVRKRKRKKRKVRARGTTGCDRSLSKCLICHEAMPRTNIPLTIPNRTSLFLPRSHMVHPCSRLVYPCRREY